MKDEILCLISKVSLVKWLTVREHFNVFRLIVSVLRPATLWFSLSGLIKQAAVVIGKALINLQYLYAVPCSAALMWTKRNIHFQNIQNQIVFLYLQALAQLCLVIVDVFHSARKGIWHGTRWLTNKLPGIPVLATVWLFQILTPVVQSRKHLGLRELHQSCGCC